MGAFPATPALAAVARILQDAGTLIHAWAGFAEVDRSLGFYNREPTHHLGPAESDPDARPLEQWLR